MVHRGAIVRHGKFRLSGRDVTAVVEKLGLRQAVLIGHSLGGGPIVKRVPDT